MSKTTVKIIDGYVIEIMHNNSLYLVDIEPIILDGNNLDLKYNKDLLNVEIKEGKLFINEEKCSLGNDISLKELLTNQFAYQENNKQKREYVYIIKYGEYYDYWESLDSVYSNFEDAKKRFNLILVWYNKFRQFDLFTLNSHSNLNKETHIFDGKKMKKNSNYFYDNETDYMQIDKRIIK